jgi:hypothetical protein
MTNSGQHPRRSRHAAEVSFGHCASGTVVSRCNHIKQKRPPVEDEPCTPKSKILPPSNGQGEEGTRGQKSHAAIPLSVNHVRWRAFEPSSITPRQLHRFTLSANTNLLNLQNKFRCAACATRRQQHYLGASTYRASKSSNNTPHLTAHPSFSFLHTSEQRFHPYGKHDSGQCISEERSAAEARRGGAERQ